MHFKCNITKQNNINILKKIYNFRDAIFNRTTSMAAEIDRKAQQIDGKLIIVIW